MCDGRHRATSAAATLFCPASRSPLGQAKMERAVFSAAASRMAVISLPAECTCCGAITISLTLVYHQSDRASESARARAAIKNETPDIPAAHHSPLPCLDYDAAQLLINSLRRNFLIMHPCLEERAFIFGNLCFVRRGDSKTLHRSREKPSSISAKHKHAFEPWRQ